MISKEGETFQHVHSCFLFLYDFKKEESGERLSLLRAPSLIKPYIAIMENHQKI